MSLPANYDQVKLSVDPAILYDAAKTILSDVQWINTNVGNISSALSGLTLSWTGQSSEDANTFQNDWNTAMQILFGTEADPSTGIFNVLLSGLGQAAANYASTEGTIAALFASFSAPASGSTTPYPNQATSSSNSGATYPFEYTSVDESF